MDTKKDEFSKVENVNEKEVMAAREVAESEIPEPAIVNPVQKHRGFMVVILAILGLCAVFVLANIFYSEHAGNKTDNAKYHSSVIQKKADAPVKALPGLTVIGREK